MNTLQTNTFPETYTVAQLAVDYPGALAVFNKYNIDYCCGGHRSIEEACLRQGLDPELIKSEIMSQQNVSSQMNFRPDQWNSSLLIEYIVQNHHQYIRDVTPELNFLLDKVCHAHGADTPELLQVRQIFHQLSEEFSEHMVKEEEVLFPALKRMERSTDEQHPLHNAVQAPISAMEHEHFAAGELLRAIRSLTNNFTTPEFACPTFKITYKTLLEFEQDLMQHIHLENNILFTRAK